LLKLREECRLRFFENRVPRIFGPKRDEVTRRLRWLEHVAYKRASRGAYSVIEGET
jgi:hypothetical protein